MGHRRISIATIHSNSFLSSGLCVIASLVVVFFYSSWSRPIWIDEYVHYSWGVFPDRFDSVKRIIAPIIDGSAEVYYASSWTYYLSDVVLLSAFGASSMALRLPSLIAGFVLIYCCCRVIRAAGFGFLWQMLVICALAAQSVLMYYSGEARPYMPLAASVMVVVLYYTTIYYEGASSNLLRTFTLLAVITGSISHLYFFPYLVGLSLLFLGLQILSSGWPRSFLGLIRQIHAPLLWTSMSLFVITQARSVLGSQSSGYDPYVWVEGNIFGLFKTLADIHLQFLPLPALGSLAIIASLLFVGLILVVVPRYRKTGATLLPPVGLAILGILMSGIISLLSLVGHYEIIPRQWSASIAMMPLAFVWFLASVARDLSTRSRFALRNPIVFIAASIVILMSVLRLGEQWVLLESYSITKASYQETFGTSPLSSDSQKVVRKLNAEPQEEWSNINIYTGGPVWEQCGYFGCPTEN